MRALALGISLAAAIGCGTSDAVVAPATTPPAPVDEPAPPLPSAETGFVEVPAQPAPGYAVPGRMFYSFHAAESDAGTKPLFVVYNGGPGAATSAGLVLAGTGPYRVDLSAPIGAMPVKSARSLVELGNVLYIDERGTGFSYDLGEQGPCYFDPVKDAADFLRVILAVIERHPALWKSKLVFFGESYGGLRTMTLVSLLLEYAEPSARALGLSEIVERWATRSLGPPGEAPFPPDRLAERILGLVLIQPLVLEDQLVHQQRLVAKVPELSKLTPEQDAYDVRRSLTTVNEEIRPRLGAALGNREASRLVFGVDLDTTNGLAPQERAGARRKSLDPQLDVVLPGVNEALSARLGKLDEHDAYHYGAAALCPSDEKTPVTEGAWRRFLLAAQYTRLFITNARYDAAVHTPAIIETLRARGSSPMFDAAPRPGVARPGWFSFDLTTDGSPLRVEVRFPRYEAGHQVPETQGPEVIEDVAAWLAR